MTARAPGGGTQRAPAVVVGIPAAAVVGIVAGLAAR